MTDLLTIFAVPKSFKGHFAVIQRNAIESWTLLEPRPEIILFGDEAGIAEIAAEFGLRHVPVVARNEFGTPLLDDVFGKARGLASSNLLCYVNADIILLNDFMESVERVSRWRPKFLMVGRRWDVDIAEPWDFSRPDSAQQLRDKALRFGKQRLPKTIDYFAFTKDFAVNMLPLAFGRFGWDRWLIWHARSLHAPVIDASQTVIAIHQNHDYSHYPQGLQGILNSEEARRNYALIGGWWREYSTADATHVLTPRGTRYNFRRWFVKVSHAWEVLRFALWFKFLDLTRPLRHRFGIRKRASERTDVG